MQKLRVPISYKSTVTNYERIKQPIKQKNIFQYFTAL